MQHIKLLTKLYLQTFEQFVDIALSYLIWINIVLFYFEMHSIYCFLRAQIHIDINAFINMYVQYIVQYVKW